MATKWTIALYNTHYERLTAHSLKVWSTRMYAMQNYNKLSEKKKSECYVVEVPATWAKSLRTLNLFLHEDEETREEILAEYRNNA